MSRTTDNLRQLVDLAKEPSSEKRRTFLHELSDLFIGEPDQFGAGETAMFDDIMTQLAGEVESTVRAELSNRFARIETAPRGLIQKLANDDISVAQPVLMHSSVLREDDLVEIARRHSQEHLLAVSKRQDVSEAVSDVLVDRGSSRVVRSLVNNNTAQISRDSMQALTSRAESDESLHEPLVKRRDVPPDLLHDMFWVVSSRLRQHILKNTESDEAEVDAVLEQTLQRMMEKPAAAEDDAAARRARMMVERAARLGQLNEKWLVQKLRGKEMPLFVGAFAKLTEMDDATARRVIFEAGHEALAVACKASGFDRGTFSSLVLLLTSDGTPRPGDEVADLIGLYDQVPLDVAKRAMRFWRVRKQAMNRQESAA